MIYLSDKHKDKDETVASKKMLDMTGIVYRQFVPSQRQIVITFPNVDTETKSDEAAQVAAEKELVELAV